jgi:hypothetical protein
VSSNSVLVVSLSDKGVDDSVQRMLMRSGYTMPILDCIHADPRWLCVLAHGADVGGRGTISIPENPASYARVLA